MQLAVHVHLALSDVARQVWNGVGDVIIRHGQNGQLSDGAFAALNTSSPLIDGGQVSVHVTWTGAHVLQHHLHSGLHIQQHAQHAMMALLDLQIFTAGRLISDC